MLQAIREGNAAIGHSIPTGICGNRIPHARLWLEPQEAVYELCARRIAKQLIKLVGNSETVADGLMDAFDNGERPLRLRGLSTGAVFALENISQHVTART